MNFLDCREGWCLSQLSLGYTLDRLPDLSQGWHRETQSLRLPFTPLASLESKINLTSICLKCRKKQKLPGENPCKAQGECANSTAHMEKAFQANDCLTINSQGITQSTTKQGCCIDVVLSWCYKYCNVQSSCVIQMVSAVDFACRLSADISELFVTVPRTVNKARH